MPNMRRPHITLKNRGKINRKYDHAHCGASEGTGREAKVQAPAHLEVGEKRGREYIRCVLSMSIMLDPIIF